MYIPGDQNTVADTLSCLPDSVDECVSCPVAAMLTVQTDPALLTSIMDGYKTDPVNGYLGISLIHTIQNQTMSIGCVYSVTG